MANERRLLIIDDEKRMADSVQSLLETSGYKADVAYSGTEGLEKIGENEYQVILTDIKMPDRDGYEVMRFVRENCPNAVVIAITGHASTESAIQAIRESAFDYIPKPYEFDVLRSAVERAFTEVETQQMREDLISMITHDIKVPLGTIIGYAQMAKEGPDGGLHPRASEFLDLISVNSQRIFSLLDNFLTTCRVDAGRFEVLKMPVNVADTLDDLRSITEMEAGKHSVELSVRVETGRTWIGGDSNLIFRALANLFHNAIKYAGSGGRVEVTLRHVEQDDQGSGPWLVFEVANTGEGIEPERLAGVFDRYARTRSSRDREGAGLGLYVVNCIVEEHGGRIAVDSAPGERTVFRVYLPPIETPLNPSDAELSLE
jgi:signal transduction histidine kinase